MEFLINKKTWGQPDLQVHPGRWGNWSQRVDRLVNHSIENPKDAFCGRIMFMLIAAYPIEMRTRIESAVNTKYRIQLNNLQRKTYEKMGINSNNDYGFLEKNGVNLSKTVLLRDGLSDATNEFFGSKSKLEKLPEVREHSYVPTLTNAGWTTSFNGRRFEIELTSDSFTKKRISIYISSNGTATMGDILYSMEKKYGFDFMRGAAIDQIEYKSARLISRIEEFCSNMKISIIKNDSSMFHPECMIIYLRPEFSLEKI